MKWKVYALFFGAIIFTVPVLYSYVTKYKLEKEEEQKVRKIWDEM
jgi:hypothetical protein